MKKIMTLFLIEGSNSIASVWKKTVILFMVLLVSNLQAQKFDKGTVKGKLVDEQNTSLPFATVLLKLTHDSSLYKGELCDGNGVFVFDLVKEGSYFIEVKTIGYEEMKK